MKELYASKYQLLLSIAITIIVIPMLLFIFIVNPAKTPIDYVTVFGVTALLIVINIFIYLSYKGKIPMYKIKE